MSVVTEQSADLCTSCGGATVQIPHELHGFGLWCSSPSCKRLVRWLGKGGPPKRKNDKWRKRWRESGPLVCRFCGKCETETRMGFEIDHIVSVEDGGADVFENTEPLCSSCHWVRNSLRHRTKRERADIGVQGQ